MSDSVISRLGDIIQGYLVIAQYKDKVVLAVNTNPQGTDKAIVWYLDYQGEPHTGNYYTDIRAAQTEFIQRAFGSWCM